MNALNEVNKVIAGVSYYPHRHTPNMDPEAEWLTPERMAVRFFFLILELIFNLVFIFLSMLLNAFNCICTLCVFITYCIKFYLASTSS